MLSVMLMGSLNKGAKIMHITKIIAYFFLSSSILLHGISNDQSALTASLSEKAEQQSCCYVLDIQFPAHITPNYTQGLKGYYKGDSLKLDEQWCLLPETQERLAFSLVITPDVDFDYMTSDGQTVSHLKRIEQLPCAWYDVTLHKEPFDGAVRKQKYHWTIELKGIDEIPIRLPSHAIVIKMSPHAIETVKEHKDDEVRTSPTSLITEKSLRTTVIHLPTLVIKPTLTLQEWEQEQLSTVFAFDTDTVHGKIECETKRDQASIMSIIKRPDLIRPHL